MSLDNEKFYRYFSFDLSIKLLKQNYPSADIRKAWTDIYKHMIANGFEHRQYSGYISQNKLDEIQTYETAFKLFKKLNWLSSCAQKFDSTAVINEQQFDFLNEFKNQNLMLLSTHEKQSIGMTQNPPKEKREDFLLPKEKSDMKELQSEKSELTLTPEQFRALSEAGIEVKVTVNPKDFEKASEILKSTNCTAQASIYKPKR